MQPLPCTQQLYNINVCRWKLKLCAIIRLCGFDSPQMLIGANTHVCKYCHALFCCWYREAEAKKEDFLIYLPGTSRLLICVTERLNFIFNKLTPHSHIAMDSCVCVAPIIVILNWPGSIGVARLQLNQNCSRRNWILFPIVRGHWKKAYKKRRCDAFCHSSAACALWWCHNADGHKLPDKLD